jgi:L-histidine N-alpha-methyltransferase
VIAPFPSFKSAGPAVAGLSDPADVKTGPATPAGTVFSDDVRRGLRQSPKCLPPRCLYDELGSTLFEAICRLPWYGVTRAETALLRARQGELSSLANPQSIVELGPGGGEKLALVAAACPRLKRVHLVDVSERALDDSAVAVAIARPRAQIIRHATTFEQGLRQALGRNAKRPTLVMLLGSTIGNYEPEDAERLMQSMSASLGPNDTFLLGADLVKPERDFLLAYDDPLGVTASFNKNVLVRINGEMGADFDLGAFAHRALWNASASRIEMHLVSRRAQAVRVGRMTVRFKKNETIWTENSYKYQPESLRSLAAAADFDAVGQWLDHDFGYALTMFRPLRRGSRSTDQP